MYKTSSTGIGLSNPLASGDGFLDVNSDNVAVLKGPVTINNTLTRATAPYDHTGWSPIDTELTNATPTTLDDSVYNVFAAYVQIGDLVMCSAASITSDYTADSTADITHKVTLPVAQARNGGLAVGPARTFNTTSSNFKAYLVTGNDGDSTTASMTFTPAGAGDTHRAHFSCWYFTV